MKERTVDTNDKSSAEEYFKQGMEYFKKKEMDKAEADFTEAIKRNPARADYFYWHGLAAFYCSAGDEEKAIPDFTEAIRLDPANAEYFYARGMFYMGRNGKNEKALADFTEAIRLDPANDEYFRWRGLLYEQEIKDYDAAIADYTEAVRLKPQKTLYKKDLKRVWEKTMANKIAPYGAFGDVMRLEIGSGLIPFFAENTAGNIQERFKAMRTRIEGELGMPLPPIHILDDVHLPANEYCFFIRGIEYGRYTIDAALSGGAIVDVPEILVTQIERIIKTNVERIVS
jgi:tetratricopeptide (TPR) repeat protein